MFIWTIRTILVFGHNSFWYVNFNNVLCFLKNMRFYGTWIYLLGAYSEKLPYVRKHPAGAFVLGKLTFLEFWDMPILGKSQFSLYLVHMGTYLVRIWYVDGTWMVREWYVDGTWMVHEWYVDGTRMVHGFDPKTEKKGPISRMLCNIICIEGLGIGFWLKYVK